jgi:hypothetical protein
MNGGKVFPTCGPEIALLAYGRTNHTSCAPKDPAKSPNPALMCDMVFFLPQSWANVPGFPRWIN